MLSETALKLGGSGHRKLSCGGGCSSSPTPPTNPFPLSSLLVDNGKGKIKQELLKKSGSVKIILNTWAAQHFFFRRTVSMIPFVSDFLSFAVTAPYVNC